MFAFNWMGLLICPYSSLIIFVLAASLYSSCICTFFSLDYSATFLVISPFLHSVSMICSSLLNLNFLVELQGSEFLMVFFHELFLILFPFSLAFFFSLTPPLGTFVFCFLVIIPISSPSRLGME